METKTICRNTYKELRNHMPMTAVSEKSRSICNRILESHWYQECEQIFAYYPLGKEADCLTVIRRALRDGKRLALPRTAAGHQMDFYAIKSLSDVEAGSYGIMEPKQECKRLEPDEGTLILVPGVAFDRKGNRYGYGAGFYDRYFARYQKGTFMALAYELQFSDETLPVLPTDKKMNVIVTENEILNI